LKRGSDNENATIKPESAKKAKVDIAYSGATGSLSEHRQNLPPDKHVNERLSKETGNVGWDTHTDLQLQDSIPSMKGRPPASGNVQKINQSPNVSIQTMHSEGTQEKIGKATSKKKIDQMQKPSNSMDGNLGKGYVHVDDQYINFNDSDDSAARKRGRHGGSFVDGKMHKRSKDANIDANSINIAKGVRGNVNHDVVMPLPECIGTNGEPSILQRNSVDKSPPVKKVLQREQSELELGELREGSLENDIERTRRQFERNSSSKSLDGKATNVDNSHPSMSNKKVAASAFHDQRKPSPQEFRTGGNINQEGMPRKTPGYDFDNRSQLRANVSQGRQLPRTDNLDSENILYPDRLVEKTGKRETEILQGGVLDHVDPKKKKITPKLPHNGTKNGIEPRIRKSISPAENEQRSRNNPLNETEIGRKRRDSSSDEDKFFFSKYDKEEPELKGPIKDFSQ
jgi:WD and tetratricopeptide repeat-containing protein 1